MEGEIPSTRTVLGMIASGLAIALVDPALQQMAGPASGVVFRPTRGAGIFVETGVVYRRDDPSTIVASFLHEVRAVPREHRGTEPLRSPVRKAVRRAG